MAECEKSNVRTDQKQPKQYKQRAHLMNKKEKIDIMRRQTSARSFRKWK